MFVSFREWEGFAALTQFLEENGPNPLVLARRCEAPRKFWSISVAVPDHPWQIGLLSSDFGPKPSAVMLEKSKHLLVGCDQHIAALHVVDRQIAHEYELKGVFYEFLKFSDKLLIAIHELGAAAFDASGERRWSISSTDIVEDWSLDERYLRLSTSESNGVQVININTGEITLVA